MGVSRRSVVAGLASVSAAPRIANAQAPPAKPLRIVVPYPAGGPTDAMARILAKELGDEHKRTVIVENKPGASGAIATREVARAEPDGTTLVLGTNQTHVTNAVLVKDPGYDPQKDFVPIAGLASLQHALVVPKASTAATVQDMISSAKANPGRLNYGSTGAGSGSHLAMELLMTRAGFRMTHVPFRGAAPMVLELVAGRLDAGFATLPSVLGQIEAGEMKALALASSHRAPQLPALTLLSESGLADADADAWLALFAPRATPPVVVAQLSRDITAIMRRPEIVAASTKLGMAVDVKDAEAFTAFLAAETRKWLDVVRGAALLPE
jgi:tripartite-type tricarboxylate transporter receptor subunit TctC